MGGSLTLLVILCIVLYGQNQSIRKANRDLIIQNDSVMSVNIELKILTNNLINNYSKRTSAIMKKKTNQQRNLD